MRMFQPAIALMHRLLYPQKFLLIGLVLTTPLALTVYLLVTELNSRVDFAQKERYGNEYLRPLRQLREKLPMLPLESEMSGETETSTAKTATDRQLIAREIATNLSALHAVDRRLGELMQTDKAVVDNLIATWQDLQANARGLQASTREYYREQLRRNVDRLSADVGDSSNLILDPDLDTYYLMDATLLKLPQMQKDLEEVRSLATILQNPAAVTPERRGRLLMLAGQLRDRRRELQRNLLVALSHNPAQNLGTRLAPRLSAYARATQQLVERLEKLLQPWSPIEAESYRRETTESLQLSFALWDEAIGELDFLLQRRIDGFRLRQLTLLGCIAVAIAIAVYLFVAFYLAVMNTVEALDRASHRMAEGSMQEAIVLENKDELGQVVRSFNNIATALIAAETKYRAIFENSIDGIFQTSVDGHYLSANPALARIYGFDTTADMLAHFTDIAQQLYVQPERRQLFHDLIREHDRIAAFESEVYRKDGSTIWIAENARAVRNEAGDMLYYEGTVEDITQRKEAEIQLARANREIGQLNERLKAENLRMGAELEVTRQLQKMLLPKDRELENLPDLEIAGFMEPADEVGGDYYDVLQHNGSIKVSIGDVTGHGLESGVLAIMVQTALRTLITHNEIEDKHEMVKLLATLNRTIYDNVQRMNSDKNLSFSLLDFDKGILTLTGQHEQMLIVRMGGHVERIDTMDLGFPIGLEADISLFVDQVQLQLHPGDAVILYTDGITEAENSRREFYGLERLCAVVGENWQLSAKDMRQRVIADVRSHIGEHRVYDDITLLVLKCK